MPKKSLKTLAVAGLLLFVMLVAGCGGGSNAKRITGLEPDGVVKTFVDAAQNSKMKEAGLYISPASSGNAKTVVKFLTGDSGLAQLKKSNVMSVKQAAREGNYAVVVATLQEQDTFNFTVKPVGLEKIKGEWYIVDFDQIYNDAKYQALEKLLNSI
ncbi:hypothetical protein HSX37_06965|uniref:DUF4878 domain-containing protein n=1 Tax=Dendrosporobacter quercicolus TaxID=146817 RepID=A0A1G9VWY3_9FIRM|nr:hypothetical protein [Dendrosporobacter quercicolus]NSL47784.1 hypothetical protein [Dendrosporobacter quercicolus DSM 1736]SDM76436.1 hypothetical protein SAMN04488502_10756 [Dendrosporobacter quercicolus]